MFYIIQHLVCLWYNIVPRGRGVNGIFPSNNSKYYTALYSHSFKSLTLALITTQVVQKTITCDMSDSIHQLNLATFFIVLQVNIFKSMGNLFTFSEQIRVGIISILISVLLQNVHLSRQQYKEPDSYHWFEKICMHKIFHPAYHTSYNNTIQLKSHSDYLTKNINIKINICHI